jgi:protein O-GlcNAc transferase
VRDRLTAQFAAHGVAPDRLALFGKTPYRDYLAAYAQVDLALDPFPYNGGTTSVEALWMGVPLISLAGDRFVGRMGLSHLSTVGLPNLVASSEDAYLALACRLATNLDALAALRASLRDRVAASPLCDAPRFAQNFQAALRQMWAAWCSHLS